MAFKSLRNHIGSLITPFIADAIAGKSDAKSAGKVAAQLRKKGPFEIDDAVNSKLTENPLSLWIDIWIQLLKMMLTGESNEPLEG